MRKSKLKCVPSEEIIIADSSPLIGLARIGQLGLLPQLAPPHWGAASRLGRGYQRANGRTRSVEVAAQTWKWNLHPARADGGGITRSRGVDGQQPGPCLFTGDWLPSAAGVNKPAENMTTSNWMLELELCASCAAVGILMGGMDQR